MLTYTAISVLGRKHLLRESDSCFVIESISHINLLNPPPDLVNNYLQASKTLCYRFCLNTSGDLNLHIDNPEKLC